MQQAASSVHRVGCRLRNEWWVPTSGVVVVVVAVNPLFVADVIGRMYTYQTNLPPLPKGMIILAHQVGISRKMTPKNPSLIPNLLETSSSEQSHDSQSGKRLNIPLSLGSIFRQIIILSPFSSVILLESHHQKYCESVYAAKILWHTGYLEPLKDYFEGIAKRTGTL
ncbi:hypothetical protein F4804DRAFT_197605 [Jackrogersella minutella]|nr:hypothetical protein F4804DRAFT_197605 [Jackrogersella minutella]